MNRKTFLRQLGLGSLAFTPMATWLSSCRSAQTSSAFPQKNWAWVRPATEWTADQWTQVLARAKMSGIDAILMEVYNGATAFFDNDHLPIADKTLERVAPICHSLGLEFHAWMWTMPCNNPAIIKAHPDWYAVNGLGQPAHSHPAYVDYYKFLCPLHPEVRQFVSTTVRALAQIPEVDGVHLDYVRLPDVILAEGLQPKYKLVQDREYPQFDYCYSDLCRSTFKAQTGIDPLTDLPDPAAHQAWRQFRYDIVTTLVNDHLAPEARQHHKTITAAVFPNWESVRQQWHHWKLDAFLPMLYNVFYNRGLDFVHEHTQKAIRRLDNSRPVYSGLFVPGMSTNDLHEAIRQAQSGGASGFALFDLAAMTDAHWAALKST